ncbi:SAR2788 family putative toxin [Bacillus mexicanus]|uniref:SAR2788 family putative toxin n=1 Tax=Bacillus mexicanus TaxID=2834415 RepID=UPI003D19D4DB
MKKIILCIMTIFILAFSLDICNVKAVEKKNTAPSSIESSNDSGAEIVKETEQDYYIQSTYKNGNTLAIADIKLNKRTNKMEAEVNLNSDGFKQIKKYDIASHELTNNIYKAIIKDKETNKVYRIDPNKTHASGYGPLKILEYLLKNGEKAAVKKHGKKAVKKAKYRKNFGVMTPRAKQIPNNVKHIMKTKHHWNKVVMKADWPSVQKTINLTLRYGKEYYVNAFFSERRLKLNGHTVVVRYNKLARPETSISTAYVK